jgi:hypothetical protein
MIDLMGKVRSEVAGESDASRCSVGLYYLGEASIRSINLA